MLGGRVRQDEGIFLDGNLVEGVVLQDVAVLLGVRVCVRDGRAPFRFRIEGLLGRQQDLRALRFDAAVADDQIARDARG